MPGMTDNAPKPLLIIPSPISLPKVFIASFAISNLEQPIGEANVIPISVLTQFQLGVLAFEAKAFLSVPSLSVSSFANSVSFSAIANTSIDSIIASLGDSLLYYNASANVTPLSISALLENTIPTVISSNFDFSIFAESYSRFRTIYAASYSKNNTAHVNLANRTVYVSSYNENNTVHVNPTNTTVYINPILRDNTVYIK